MTEDRMFEAVLAEVQKGRISQSLASKLREVVKAVQATGQKGSISLTLKIQPAGGMTVKVLPEVKTTVPEGEQETSIFFVTDEGDLSRSDPRQPQLPGTTVPRLLRGGAESDE